MPNLRKFFKPIVTALTALAVFVAPLQIGLKAGVINQAHAEDIPSADHSKLDLNVGENKLQIETQIVASVEELKDALRWADDGGFGVPVISVYDAADTGVDLELLKNDLSLVQDAAKDQFGSESKTLEFNESQTKGFLNNLRAKKSKLKDRLTRFVDKVSQKHELTYRLSFSTARAVGLFGAVTYSFITLGLAPVDAMAGAAVASTATFAIQMFGSKYLEILGDPQAFTKFYKWIRTQEMKHLRFKTDSEIGEKLDEIDKAKFWQWLNKQENTVSYALYLLTELPIVIAVMTAVHGAPADWGSFMVDASLISVSALASQGVVDSALAYGRRGKLRNILNRIFPQLESDLAEAKSNYEREHIIKSYENRLESVRSSGFVSEDTEGWEKLFEAGREKSIVEFNMNLNLLIVAVFANSAAFLAGGDLIEFLRILKSGALENLNFAQSLGYSGVFSMMTGGVGYKAYLKYKYDAEFRRDLHNLKRTIRIAKRICSNLLSK
jgi:hypothetical protein